MFFKSSDAQDKEVPTTLLNELQILYKKKVLPIEAAYQFDYFYSPLLSDNEIKSKPMVLLVGQYSTGKTTFIQNILGREYPGGRIGPEPTTDRFVAVMNGPQERIVPGSAAAIQVDKPFNGLSRFGSNFLSKFSVSELPSQLLDSIIIIDTPGVLSGDKQKIGRSYDFAGVCKWFAEHSDLILLFFDSHKLDISDELKEVLHVLRPFDDKIRIILNKVDQIGKNAELMRIYGALLWSLGKVINTPEVPRVYLGSFKKNEANSEISFDNERLELISELKRLPMSSAIRKINDLVKRARLARVHAILINSLKSQMPSWFGKSTKQSKLLSNLSIEVTKVQNQYRIPIGDFPDIEIFEERLRGISICNFPKLSNNKLTALTEAIQVDIPKLMEKYPPVFGDLTVLLNPFQEFSSDAKLSNEQIWRPENVDIVRYNSIFHSLSPEDDELDGPKCRQFFQQSGLSQEEMSKLWSLSDVDRNGRLSLPEFSVMMHLVNLKMKGFDIPDELPSDFVIGNLNR